MPTPWIRLDAGYDFHPSIDDLCWQARFMYPHLIMQAKLHRLGGTIPPKYATARKMSRITDCPLDVSEAAMSDLAASDLVEVRDDGSWLLTSYHQWQTDPKSPAERKADQRERENREGE